MSLLAHAPVMTFIVTRDRAAARRFYEDVLGFRLTHEDGFAAVFTLRGAILRVTTMEGHAPASHTVLGWSVDDIEAAVDALAARGVVFTRYDGIEQDARGIWKAPAGDARVAWFTDPDGNVLSLATT